MATLILQSQSWSGMMDAQEPEQIKRDIETLVGGCKDVLVGHMVYS